VTKQGVSAIVSTRGNSSCHLILRGGNSGPNYQKPQLDEVEAKLAQAGLPPFAMIDCSHGNSGKDYRRQSVVARDLAAQIAGGSRMIAAVMLESALVEGRQEPNPDRSKLTYGQSVTDACIGWEETAVLLDELAGAVRARRQRAGK
jgi:3-deoxy-7-phosphoheptulonate synthase